MGTHPSSQGSACLYMLVPRAAGEHVASLCWEQQDTQLHWQLSAFQDWEGKVMGLAMSLQDPRDCRGPQMPMRREGGLTGGWEGGSWLSVCIPISPQLPCTG